MIVDYLIFTTLNVISGGRVPRIWHETESLKLVPYMIQIWKYRKIKVKYPNSSSYLVMVFLVRELAYFALLVMHAYSYGSPL